MSLVSVPKPYCRPYLVLYQSSYLCDGAASIRTSSWYFNTYFRYHFEVSRSHKLEYAYEASRLEVNLAIFCWAFVKLYFLLEGRRVRRASTLRDVSMSLKGFTSEAGRPPSPPLPFPIRLQKGGPTRFACEADWTHCYSDALKLWWPDWIYEIYWCKAYLE